MNYWYIGLENTYPKNGKVRQVELKSSYSLIEMHNEASPMEVNEHKLIELGRGFFSCDHIQENYRKFAYRINRA